MSRKRLRMRFLYLTAVLSCAYLTLVQMRFRAYVTHDRASALETDEWNDTVDANCSSIKLRYSAKYPLQVMNYNIPGGKNRSKLTWRYAQPAMNKMELTRLRHLLRLFVNSTSFLNITYFAISGTLLGSHRHHGMMPWDDDVDVLMRNSERDNIFTAFESYCKGSEELQVAHGPSGRMKIFHKVDSVHVPIKNFTYRWPLIDVTFYNENATHLWQYNDSNVLPKDLVFPLHDRPFEGVQLASPRDGFAVLKRLYRNPNCVSLTWSHKLEKSKRSTRFKCEEFSNVYPFVHRRTTPGGCMVESLMLGNSVIHEVVVDEPSYAVSKSYILQLVDPT